MILGGRSGRRKTHLAVSIAYRAIQNGYDARFTAAAQLIEKLPTAARDGRLTEALHGYVHPHVLIIDEVGYLTYSDDAANVLFRVVDHRYLHRKPMLFITNKPLSQWGTVLHDPDLAEAITDRVLERGRFIELRGPSHRTRHLKEAERPDAPEPVAPDPAQPGGTEGVVEPSPSSTRTLHHPAPHRPAQQGGEPACS